MTQRNPLVSSLLLLGTFALAAPAQQTQQIEADTTFAEGLARRWQFVDLAEEVLDGIQNDYDLSETQSERLGLVRCEVYGTAARRERDPERRKELYREALKAYQDFIAENEYSTLLPEAEGAWVQLANTFAAALELELEDQIGDEAQATREEIREVLDEPLSRTGALIEGLRSIEEPSEADKRDLAALMLDRGKMLATMGRVSDDGTFYYGQAEAVLERLATEYGEFSGWGLQAFLEYARVRGDQGEWRDAQDFYQFVIDAVMLPSYDEWLATKEQLTPADLDWFRAFTEFSLPGILEASMNNGDVRTATTYALRFWNRYTVEGFNLSVPRGYLAALAAAEVLLDAGGYVGGRVGDGDLTWFESEEAMADEFSSRRDRRSAVDMALDIAQLVNEDNQGNTLQTRAQKLISKIIESPGVELGPELLFQAASGHYADRDYPQAILGFKRVMASLENQDEATIAEFAPNVLNKLGRAYANEKRYLEATMVFREAVTTYGGDPLFDSQNSKAMLAAVGFVRSASDGDPLVEELYLAAERFVIENDDGGDTDDIEFRQAIREYQAKNYQAALTKFQAIEKGSTSWEKAQAYIGACHYRLGDESAAKASFTAYLDDFLGSPDAALSEGDEIRRANRIEARSLATYYMGRMADKAGNAEEALRYLANFHDEFPSQDQMAPNTLYMSLNAFLDLGRVPQAREQYEVLSERFPDHSRTGISADLIYKAVSDLHDAAPEGSAERTQHLQAMAELMKTSNRLDDSPTYGSLRREALHWIDLANWTEAERVLRKMVKRFADDPAQRENMYMRIQPDLGLALLEQDKRPEALEILREVVPVAKPADGAPAPEFRPYPRTIDSFFRAAVGGVEGDSASEMVEVIGAGTPEDVLEAAQWMEVLSRTKEKFTVEWYEYKFNQIFAWRRLAETDSSQQNVAKDLIQTMRTDVDANFNGIATDYENAGLDGEPAQARWRWLSKELN